MSVAVQLLLSILMRLLGGGNVTGFMKAGEVILTVQLEDVRSRADFVERLSGLCNSGERNALLFVKSANGTTRWLTLPLRL
jgi:hypothetical protein